MRIFAPSSKSDVANSVASPLEYMTGVMALFFASSCKRQLQQQDWYAYAKWCCDLSLHIFLPAQELPSMIDKLSNEAPGHYSSAGCHAVDSRQHVKLWLIFAWCCTQLYDRHDHAGGQCRDFADGATDRGGDESRLSCQVPGVSLSSSLVLWFSDVQDSS